MWLARERSTHSARDDQGRLQSDTVLINARFAQYCKHLYTSRTNFTSDSLRDFLALIEFPTLSYEASMGLDAPITLKEVQLAISSLQLAKTPCPDGVPTEFYKVKSEFLAPQFHELLLSMLEDLCLPPSLLEAVIVVIPKPNKDPEL